jgi:hypothetical protein
MKQATKRAVDYTGVRMTTTMKVSENKVRSLDELLVTPGKKQPEVVVMIVDDFDV